MLRTSAQTLQTSFIRDTTEILCQICTHTSSIRNGKRLEDMVNKPEITGNFEIEISRKTVFTYMYLCYLSVL